MFTLPLKRHHWDVNYLPVTPASLLPPGHGTAVPATAFSNLNLIKLEPQDMPTAGDLKFSLLQEDHDGWFLLDGRTVAELPAEAAAKAADVGYTDAIPDATGSVYFGTDPATPAGAVAGENYRTIDRSMLPVESLTVTVDSAGEHTHTYTSVNGKSFYYQTGSTSWYADQDYATKTTNPAGTHVHTAVTEPLNSGGTQNAFSVVPKTLVANAFLYLTTV